MSGVLSLGGGAGRAGGNNTGIWLVLASDVCFGKVTLSGLRTTVRLTVHSWSVTTWSITIFTISKLVIYCCLD